MENYTTDDGQIVEYYSDFEETFCKFLKGPIPYIVESCFEDGLHTHRLGFLPIEYLTKFYDDGWVVIKHHTEVVLWELYHVQAKMYNSLTWASTILISSTGQKEN